MINNKAIAILMATYNAERYVSEQIDSILQQTFSDWTLYIRDDGSKDRTLDILSDYEKKYSNIVVIRDNKGNLGCRDNFFELLLSVESKYYMFSDADDFWMSQKIEWSFDKLLELESEHKNLPIVVHTDMIVADTELNTISSSMWRAGKTNPDKIKSYNYLGIHGYVGGATMIFNQMAKEVSMPINRNVYMHDLWIGLCTVKAGILYSLDKQTLLYRQHSNNAVGGAIEENLTVKHKIENIFKVININLKTYKMLHKIGYGSFAKYLYYKIKLILLMRGGKMFND